MRQCSVYCKTGEGASRVSDNSRSGRYGQIPSAAHQVKGSSIVRDNSFRGPVKGCIGDIGGGADIEISIVLDGESVEDESVVERGSADEAVIPIILVVVVNEKIAICLNG